MATFRKSLKDFVDEANAAYTSKQQNYADYQGHPFTKMYDDIVPEENLQNPTLKNLDYYANNFGIDTSVANLQSKFDKLTKQQYAQKNAEFLQSENEYYKNMAAQNAQYQQGVQNAMSQALAAGSSRGMQFANQFAAQNALAEQNSTGALDLATQRNNLKAQEAEAYAQNVINAEQTAYDRKANILQQAIADRANEVQRYAADATLKANTDALRINNYQYNMTNELSRLFKDMESDDTRWVALLNAALNNHKYNLEDDLGYAEIASNERIQQMMRNAGGYSSNNELTYDEMIETYLNASEPEKAALRTKYSDLAAAVARQNELKKAYGKEARSTGEPVSYTSIKGNQRWMLPDGSTMSDKEYKEWLKKQTAQKQRDAEIIKAYSGYPTNWHTLK